MDNETLGLLRIISSPLLWAENFLLDPVTGKPFKANYVERQILESKNDLNVIRVHRRAGKTYSLTVLALWAALTQEGHQILILCPDQGKVSEIFKVIDDFIAMNPLVADSVDRRTKSPEMVTFKTGTRQSRILGKTLGSGSKKEGATIRGFGANLLIIDEAAYLKEEDFAAITAIITGNDYTGVVRAYAASTPTQDQGRYWEWCSNKDLGWHEIHVSILDNPDVSETKKQLAKSLSTEKEWITEQLAEFPDVGENAIKTSDLLSARYDYVYNSYENPPKKSTDLIRVMGVDWDSSQAGVSVVILELIAGTKSVKVVYSKELPQGEFSITNSIKEIIKLNELFQPEHIYVDRGYGDTQVEELRLYGIQNPSSGLDKKVKAFQFNQNIEFTDPSDGARVKKQFKTFMVNNMVRMFENHYIQFSVYDVKLYKQLQKYKITGSNSRGISTSSRDEHLIDALGLAMYGVFINYLNDLRFTPQVDVVVKKMPERVPSIYAIEKDRDLFGPMKTAVNNGVYYSQFGRGHLCNREPSRKKI